MFGSKSPIENAYYNAVSNRLFSIVYFVLDEHVPPEDRESFRKDWAERGSYHLAEILLRCASPDWASYPETFCMRTWIAEHLVAYEPARLCYIIDQWLDGQPLPPLVSDDPLVEDRKVKELGKLFSALNR